MTETTRSPLNNVITIDDERSRTTSVVLVRLAKSCESFEPVH
jgi:hypothetical protein